MAIFVCLVIAVIIHEMGHVLVARRYGLKVGRIRFLPFGASVDIDCAFLDDDKKTIIYFAGSGANMLVAIFCGTLLWLFPSMFIFLEIFIIANFVPAILNLLPIYPLDGGKILRLHMTDKGFKRVILTTNVVFVAILVTGCILFNLPMIIFSVMMILMMNMEFKGIKMEPSHKDKTLLEIYKHYESNMK